MVKRNLVPLLIVAAMLCGFAVAQEPQTEAPAAQQVPAGTQPAGTDQESSSNPDALVPPPTKADGTITSISDGSPLRVIPGMFHGGPLYLGSVQLSGSYERDAFGGNHMTRGVGILSTYIFFMKEIGRKENKITLQYAPSIAVADGRFNHDLGGHDAEFDTSFKLTSRLNMKVHDGFHYAGLATQQLKSGLLADPTSGYSQQTDPLLHAGSYWTDEASLGFTYDMSARTRISFDPNFSIVRSSGAAAQQGMSYGTGIQLSHDLTARTTIGLLYSAQFSTYQAALADTLYHRFGLSFGHTFGRGWMISGDIAAGTSSSQQHNTWTPEPTLSISKAFRRSGFAAVFTRTNAFYGLQNGYVNQVDGTYHVELNRRTQLSFGGGTYRQSGTGVRNNSYYGQTGLSVSVLRSLGWSISYMYRNQDGDASFLSNGRRNLWSTALTWRPGRPPAE